jgi:Domain of unknown function (DUF4271)
MHRLLPLQYFLHLQLSFVNRFLYLLLFQLLFVGVIFAQRSNDSTANIRADSLLQKDTITHRDSLLILQTGDSVSKKPHKDSTWQLNGAIPFFVQNLNQQILQHHPYLGFTAKPLTVQSDIQPFHGKELLFYTLIFLLLIYALLHRAFPKYFNDLFRLFFRTTIKPRQIREQLIQTPLPSLLLNVFFVVSAGLYISFLLQHFKVNPVESFWLMFLYCILGLAVIYCVKFLGLKLSGWLFNMQEAADSYIFIVFIVNKMVGLLLLPFLILLAFTQGNVYSISLNVSMFVVACLLVYRFVLTYATVRNQVKVNPFHLFLYFCAFELAPLLLIYKGLLLFFHITS